MVKYIYKFCKSSKNYCNIINKKVNIVREYYRGFFCYRNGLYFKTASITNNTDMPGL